MGRRLRIVWGVKHVVVACDFSPYSRRALALAMQAYPFGGTDEVVLELLHVVDESLYLDVLAADRVPKDDAIEAYLKAEVERARREVEDAGGRVLLTPRLVIAHGPPYQRIVDHAERVQAYCVMLGGQGHGGAGEKLLGRTAQRIVRHAPCSVYVTRHFRDYLRPVRILAALDCSEHSRRALELADEIATRIEGTFSTIRVVGTPYVPYLEVFAHEPEIEPYVEKAVNTGYDELVAFETAVLGAQRSDKRTVFSGRVVESITMLAESQRAGTLVVGSHGRTGLPRFLLGSVAEGLVSTSRVDVLVVR